MNYRAIIDKYYPEDNELKKILIVHSQKVTDKALKIADAHPELMPNRQFIEEAAMLHDIGIYMTDAEGIQCFGAYPYICHGMLGADIMRKEGFPDHARVCERHTGTGLTKSDIISQQLPLPHQDFIPETIEEQIICYADKFFSKTHPEREKTFEQALKSIAKFGSDSASRFTNWATTFEDYSKE